jgi:plastocyanin
LNAWPVDRDGILIGTAGHLHPGGLHDDLFLDRPGAPDNGTAHLFSSVVHYFEPAGAVSWDAAMTATNPGWQVAVHPGDTLRLSTTYDTSKASWYESMGIMVVWMADGTDGADPFATPVDNLGSHLTHGHLAENDNHGGGAGAGSTDDPAKLGTVPAPADGEVDINDFTYGSGDLTVQAPIPTVQQGQSLLFVNKDAPTGIGIWHSITACKAPCNQATGIAYPLADGDVTFDSGQLGQAGPPTAGRLDWPTPDNLPVGTYTYFCRIHPFMRGAFTVTAKG